MDPLKAAGSGQKPQPQQWSASQWGMSTHGLYLDPCYTRKKRKLFASHSCKRVSCSSFPQSNTEHSALLFAHTHPEAPGKAEVAQTKVSHLISLLHKQCSTWQLESGWLGYNLRRIAVLAILGLHTKPAKAWSTKHMPLLKKNLFCNTFPI